MSKLLSYLRALFARFYKKTMSDNGEVVALRRLDWDNLIELHEETLDGNKHYTFTAQRDGVVASYIQNYASYHGVSLNNRHFTIVNTGPSGGNSAVYAPVSKGQAFDVWVNLHQSSTVQIRIDKQIIIDSIKRVEYWHPEGTGLTVCCLVFKNGFVQTGESCASNPKEFDMNFGKKYAYDDALTKSFKYFAWDEANNR